MEQREQTANIIFTRPTGQRVLITQKDKDFLFNWNPETKKSTLEIVHYINLVYGI
jgi:hypothetical protein